MMIDTQNGYRTHICVVRSRNDNNIERQNGEKDGKN